MSHTHNLTQLTPVILLKKKSPNKVLVIITRRIGDVLLTTPLIHTLKTAWPQAKIDVLVFENTRDILSNHPDIHNIISVPKGLSKLQNFRWLISMWHKYDLSISALTSDRATMYAWLTGKQKIGLLDESTKQTWKKWLLDDWITFDNSNTHTISMGLMLSSRLGLAPQFNINVKWTLSDEKLVGNLLNFNAIQDNQRYAVLHTYPKFSYKMWSSEGWLNLASWLDEQNIIIILTGSKDSSEMLYIQELLAKLPQTALSFAGQLNFPQMAYLLKKATVYVGPDTVATHLSAALGTPTVALFGPSNPVKWGPWPKGYHEMSSPWVMKKPYQKVNNVTLLQGLSDCVPCYLEGCDKHINSRSKCLDELPASRVIDAIKALLS
jgi:heptosyltransferase-3